MSTQQDIYVAGSESRPPMLNKENYVPWSSRLLRYAKSRPNGKLIHNSIINGPYVRRMIPEPGDTKVPVNETFYVQTDNELTKKELKQIEADDQAIQTILLGLPKDIYAAVDSCESAQEIWLRVQQMMKGFDIGIQEKKAKLFNEWERFTFTEEGSIESYYHYFLKLMNDLKQNKHFSKKIASNLKFLNNLQPEWCRHVTIVHQTKDLHTADYTQLYDFLKYNQKENVGNLNGYNAVQNVGNQVIQNAAQNARVRNIGNQNGLIGVLGNANQNLNGNGNLVAARAEGNAAGHNSNQIRCYNCRVVSHFARNCTVRPRRRDAAYLQTQLLIAQKEEVGIQLQAEEFDLMAAAADLDEIEEVNANCILMVNLQQTLTSDLNKQLSKEKSTVSFLLGEKKKLKSDFKTREYELLDKKIQLEKKIKELNNILVKTGQSIQMIHMLSPKPDSFYHTKQKMALGYQNPFYLKQAHKKQQSLYNGKVLLEKHDPPVVHDLEETLQLAQESREKMKQLNKEIKPANYTKINHLLGVKSTIVTLQRVVKHRMTLETHNWSSSAHQELHKIIKDENFPIVNQVDTRVKNFEIQLLKEAAKFVGDFKSLAKEADESLAKHKALELEIERLLRAVVSQDIMYVMQKASVVDTSNL
nr:hypothetical protein [Tanacetum cinerariifolium]